jgi:hypothetical protein
LVRLRSAGHQYHGTFFLRNRPELKLLRDIANEKALGSTLTIAVLACRKGAEVYSVVWAVRSARPDLNLIIHAVDISNDVVKIAEEGLYSTAPNSLVNSQIFERLTEKEVRLICDREGENLKVLKEGIIWHVADVRDPALPPRLQYPEVVLANRFLCHMNPADAESCLRRVARLVKRGGFLFVSGVDLDVRTKVALDMGWCPIAELLEVHNGDPSLRRDWPWHYWGLEPLNRRRPDWNVRYASVFKLSPSELQMTG